MQPFHDEMEADPGDKNHEKQSEPIQRVRSDAPVDNFHARYAPAAGCPCPWDCCHARATNPRKKYINATIRTTVTKLAGVQETIAASAICVLLAESLPPISKKRVRVFPCSRMNKTAKIKLSAAPQRRRQLRFPVAALSWRDVLHRQFSMRRMPSRPMRDRGRYHGDSRREKLDVLPVGRIFFADDSGGENQDAASMPEMPKTGWRFLHRDSRHHTAARFRRGFKRRSKVAWMISMRGTGAMR